MLLKLPRGWWPIYKCVVVSSFCMWRRMCSCSPLNTRLITCRSPWDLQLEDHSFWSSIIHGRMVLFLRSSFCRSYEPGFTYIQYLIENRYRIWESNQFAAASPETEELKLSKTCSASFRKCWVVELDCVDTECKSRRRLTGSGHWQLLLFLNNNNREPKIKRTLTLTNNQLS